MRLLLFFVLQIGLCSVSTCHAGGCIPSFRVLIIHEKKTAHRLHEIDAKDMTKTFRSIAQAVERPIYIKHYESRDTSIGKIKKWCSKITKFDTAIVYYSGSNPEIYNYNGTWPMTKIARQSVPVDLLANMVQARKARLSLVFADCYNKCFNAHAIIRRSFGSPLKKIRSKHLVNKLKDIWFTGKGSLTMCSNKQGDASYGMIVNKKKDCVFGVFTEALLMYIGGRGTDHPSPICLSNLPNAICNHIQHNSCFTPTKQSPFYQSTIHE